MDDQNNTNPNPTDPGMDDPMPQTPAEPGTDNPLPSADPSQEAAEETDEQQV